MLLGVELLFLGFLVLWQHGAFVPMDPPTSTDFVSFYAAGKLALAGTPALAYDQAAHAAAEVAATAPGIEYQFFFYPPVYLLLCAPLALLPYLAAFVVFQAATLAAWLLVMRRVILTMQGWAWCVPVLAYPAVFWTLGLGQNAFLTAALLGGTTLLLDKRPVLAGVLLGLLCYKPHLALLAPVALAAGGRWRSFAAAAATVAAVVGLSVALFGLDTWRAYLTALADRRRCMKPGGSTWPASSRRTARRACWARRAALRGWCRRWLRCWWRRRSAGSGGAIPARRCVRPRCRPASCSASRWRWCTICCCSHCRSAGWSGWAAPAASWPGKSWRWPSASWCRW